MFVQRKGYIGDLLKGGYRYQNDGADSRRLVSENYHNAPPYSGGSQFIYTPDGAPRRVWNSSGEVLPQFSIVGLDEIIIQPDKNLPEFQQNYSWWVTKPKLPDHKHRFGVTLKECGIDEPTEVVTNATVPVLVDVTNLTHQFAKVVDGNHTHLQSDKSEGVPIFSMGDQTGIQWCVVRLDSAGAAGGDVPQIIEFSNTAPFALTDGSVAANVTQWWEGEDPDPGGAGITVYNTCGQFFAETAGKCGIARWAENMGTAGQWMILMMWEQRTRFIYFTTDGPVYITDPTFAVNVQEDWDGIGTSGLQVVHNTGAMFQAPAAGWPGIARWDYPDDPKSQSGKYQCVYMKPPNQQTPPGISTHIEFTLNEDLAITADSAQATVTKRYNGVAPLDGTTVTVWNTCYEFGGTSQTCGVAVWNTILQRWQIIVMWEKYARFIEFQVSQDFNKAADFIPVTLISYWDGVAPTVTQVRNTSNLFKGYGGWRGIARYDYYDAEYQAVYVDRNWALRWITFNTTTTFGKQDAGPHTVNVTGYWNGLDPGATVGVMNTGGIFRSDETDLPGIAAEQENGTWQIVQLECVSPANQAVYTSDQTSPSLPSYDDTPVVLPFAAFEHSAGDLITINANNEIEFLRAARGAIRVEIGANWDAQLGSNTDTSVLKFQIDMGQGAGWETIDEAGLSFTHVYQRIPPSDYIMGGSASRSYWSQTAWPAGAKIRVTAETLLGELITDMTDFTIEILETYDTPLGGGGY